MKVYLFFLFSSISLFSEGLKYELFYVNYGLQSVHVIEIDPNFYEIKPVKALDDGIGRESVLSMNTRYGAIASVNGGFFSIGGTFDGKACGALKIHDWFALPNKPRGCIGWSQGDFTPKMDRLLIDVVGSSERGEFLVNGLNRPRKEGEMILFTPCFHRTTLTNPDGVEIVVVNGHVEKIVKGGSSRIPENGLILSIQENHPLISSFEIGMSLSVLMKISTLTGFTSSQEWDFLDYVVGGTPLLLQQSAKILDFELEQTISTFLTNRHARTAVGILPNGHWMFVVVDKTGYLDGMTIDELSDLMAGLGCVQALNLDGGGSSTMVFEGTVKNSPHGDEDEGAGQSRVRRVSDAILVVPKK